MNAKASLASFAVLVSLAVGPLAACGGSAEAEGEDLEPNLGTTTAALVGDYGYYAARLDLRRCAFPLCGGVWIRSLNATTTKCADGTYQSECYVAEVNAGAVSTDPAAAWAEGKIYRGSLGRKLYAGFGRLGVLTASEVWVPASTNPTQAAIDKYYRVTDETATKVLLRETKLNSNLSSDIAAVDLSGANAPDKEAAAMKAIVHASLLVAGTNKLDAARNVTLVASQFYFPFGAPTN